MPLIDFLKPAEKYVLKECRDAAMFAMYAVMQGYKVNTEREVLRLAKEAGLWVLKHGTPTLEKVKEELGL